MKFNPNALLKNKMVLYLVLFLSLVNILNNLNSRNYTALLVFLLTALLVKCFNKNNTVVLGSALVVTHFLASRNYPFGHNGFGLLEGLVGVKPDDPKKKDDPVKPDDLVTPDDSVMKKSKLKHNPISDATNTVNSSAPVS